MRLRRAVSLMMMMMMMLDFTNYVWTLQAPAGVSMQSVNMRHVLRWRPLQAACNTTALYSVQFQGEFELLVLNGSWLDAHECQRTPQAHCDLTFDLGSDSDYNLQVRALCGSQLSAWSRLSRPFNRRETLLTAPDMAVTAVGDALQVTFNTTLPLTAAVVVTLWKKGEEAQPVEFSVPAEQRTLHSAALQEGAVYCVRAHTVLNTHLNSSSTDTQCVSITGAGADAAWKRPTTVTVTLIIAAGVLFAVFWSVVHCHSQACKTYFQKEPLPRSLGPDWDIQAAARPEDEVELCEPVLVLQSDER